MRRIGGISAIALAVCLAAVAVAMAGGPEAPFTRWAADVPPPAAGQHDHAARRADPGHSMISRPAPGSRSEPAPSASAPDAAAPAPSAGSTPRPSPTGPGAAASSSAAPTNPAGHTPPGHAKSSGSPHGH